MNAAAVEGPGIGPGGVKRGKGRFLMRRPVTVAASASLSPLPSPLHFQPLARWALLGALAAATAGCGQAGEQGFSSTLETPANPGDGYSLVRVADSEHLIEHIAVTGDYLFFSMFWHGVYAMPRYGGDVTPVDTDTNAEDIALAASPTDVVWIKARFGANDIPNEQLRRRAASRNPIANLKQGNLHAISSSLAENLQVTASQALSINSTVRQIGWRASTSSNRTYPPPGIASTEPFGEKRMHPASGSSPPPSIEQSGFHVEASHAAAPPLA